VLLIKLFTVILFAAILLCIHVFIWDLGLLRINCVSRILQGASRLNVFLLNTAFIFHFNFSIKLQTIPCPIDLLQRYAEDSVMAPLSLSVSGRLES